MALITWLRKGDEIVIEGRTVIRLSPNSPNAKIMVEVADGAERHDIIKRPRTGGLDGK